MMNMKRKTTSEGERKKGVKPTEEHKKVKVKVEEAEELSESALDNVDQPDAATSFMSPMFDLTSTNILDSVLLKEEDRRSSTKPKTDISTSMFQAYKSASLNKPATPRRGRPPAKASPTVTNGKTSSRSTLVNAILPPSIRNGATPARVNGASTTLRPRTTKPNILSRTKRVVGGEADIRSQLLSKFTEVAAAKNESTHKRRSATVSPKEPVETKFLPNTTSDFILESLCEQVPSSSHQSIKSRCETMPKRVSSDLPSNSSTCLTKVPPRPRPRAYQPSSKFSRQNIAFADPGRKVAGVVQSMFSSAITKVLTSQTSKNTKPLFEFSPSKLTEVPKSVMNSSSSEKTKFCRPRRNKDTRYESDDEDESILPDGKAPWEYDDNDEDSDNYEETEGMNFSSDLVKVEMVTDEQEDDEYDFDSHSNTVRLSGQEHLDANLEDNDDPLADSSYRTIKIETGTDSFEVVPSENQLESQFFGGECPNEDVSESEETDQKAVDVKPELIPIPLTDTDCNITISHIQTLAENTSSSPSSNLLIQTVIKSESAEVDIVDNKELEQYENVQLLAKKQARVQAEAR